MTIRPRLAGLPRTLLGSVFLLGLLATGASATRWLCPASPDHIVDRPADARDLYCPACGTTYQLVDLIPTTGYINSRTRDGEVLWSAQADSCEIFRLDGLEAIDSLGAVWVPWSLVEWYIPRQRLLRLRGGRELATDYPKSPERCPNPPRFSFDVVDSLTFPGTPASSFTMQENVTMAELFLVAMSPEARDSARVRFITGVEAGKFPRLPRTQPSLYRAGEVRVPEALAKPGLKNETIVEIRVHENRGVIGVRVIKSSGIPELDQEAIRVARSSGFVTGGEMGVGVPAWVRGHVYFEGSSGRMELEPAPRGFWRR